MLSKTTKIAPTGTDDDNDDPPKASNWLGLIDYEGLLANNGVICALVLSIVMSLLYTMPAEEMDLHDIRYLLHYPGSTPFKKFVVTELEAMHFNFTIHLGDFTLDAKNLLLDNSKGKSNALPFDVAGKEQGLMELEASGWMSNVGLPNETLHGVSKVFTAERGQMLFTKEKNLIAEKITSLDANVNALFNKRKTELAYVQDREFGTYENNLTGQTVNAEAEKIFADQNKVRDAINTELVQKHNDSLKPTYSTGDTGLARQLESKTYGVDGDLNVVTPGYETKFIDEFSDTHGTSKQTGVVDLQKVTTDNEFFGSTTKYVSEAAAESIEILANNQKVSDEKAAEALALLGLEKSNGTQNNIGVEVDIPYQTNNNLQTLINETSEDMQYVPYKQDPEGGTSENNLTGQTVYNPRKLELERQKEDALKAAQARIDIEKYNRLAFQDSMMKEQNKVKNGAVTAAYEPGNRTPNILTEEQIQANFKRQEEGFQDVISNTTAEDMQETIDIGSQQKVVKTSNTNSVRDAMEEQKKNLMADGSPNGRGNRKSQIKEKSPSFADTRDGSLTGKDPFRFSTLAYPESITTDPQYGHFILFYVNVQNKTKYSYRGYNNDGDEIDVGDKYYTSKTGFFDDGSGRRPGSGGGSEYKTVVTEHTGAIEQGLASEVSYQKQQHLDGQLGSNHLRNNQVTLMKARKARAGIDTVLDLTTRITDSVAIYLPSAINDNVKAGYQDFNTGFAGFIALSGGKILRNIANNDFEGAARAFIGKGKDILLDLGKRAAIGAYGGLLSGDGVTNAFDKAFGQTVNPFIEVAFDSMGVRTFNYTFDFRPKSSRETEEVQAIIKLFRFHMVPEQKGSNHRYMTLPSTFDIHYMYQTNEASKENEFYSKIATCVLTGCDVDYTPDGVKSFESGAPTHITMALNFMETEMLTKEKINDGF